MRTSMLSLCAFVSLTAPALAAVVTNPSFEFGVPVMGGPLVTDWRWDGHNFVTTENGITPFAGNQMLKFIDTSGGGSGPGVVSDIFQIVDLTSLADQAVISTGFGVLSIGAVFNRVPGPVPSPVDTRFDINVRSHTSYGNAQALAASGLASNTLISDANLNTWEGLVTTLALPIGTQYITIHLAAVENVVNDNGPPEFQGHYCDDVQLRLTPAPGAIGLAALGGLFVARRRR